MPEQPELVLPVHPRTGLTALGIVAGRPVWPILGASDEHDDDDDTGEGADAAGSDDGSDADAAAGSADADKPLGPAGEKALQAEKDKRRAAQRELREWKSLGLTPEQIRSLNKPDADGGDQAPDLDAIREQARAEARAESLKDKAMDKLEAKAARLFKNPDDARKFLSDRVSDFIDGDTVDVEAITDAIGDLLMERPYLGVAQGDGDGRPKFSGTGDAGPRNGNKPGQVTEDELKRMTPEQIVQARKEGRLRAILGAN